MSGFAPLFYFLITVLVLREGRANKPENEPRMGIIGAIIDNSSRIGKEERVAIEMAVEDFYANRNQRLALHIRNSQREDPLQAALAAYISNAIALIKSAARDLIDGQQVQAILGPHTWEETSLVVKVGSETNTPIVSFAEATPKWATELWPFLVQASRDRLKQMEAIADIVQSWEWHRVTVIYQDRDSLANEVLPHLSYALRQVGAEISHLVALQPFASSSLIEELEKLQKDQCRVFVVHLSVPLAAQLFEKAKEMKMMEKDYVWITTDPITSLVNSFNASSISSMQGIIGVKSYFTESGNQFQDFYHRFCRRFRSEHPEEGNNEPSIFAAQAYDAARAVALALTEGSKGRKLLAKLLRSDLHGLSGRIKFTDQNLAPQHVFQIINVVGRSYRELGYWSDGIRFSKTIGESASNYSSMKDLGPVVWPGEPWYTPKGVNVPIQATALRIGVPNGSTFKEYVNVEKDPLGNNLSFTGLAIDLFKATLEELPYYLPYELCPFNGTYDSLVEQIHLHKFDAVVGDVAIVSRRYEHAEFTHPYTEAGLVMIVPVMSKTCNKAWLFMRPFTKPMWALIGAINIYNGFVVWLIERNHCPKLKGSVLNQIGSLIWLSFTTLFSLHAYLREVLDIHNIKQFDSIEEYAEALKSEVIAAAFLEAPLAKIFLRKYCNVFMEAGPTFKVGGFGFVML
ncbi:glutamate receptor 2.8 [Prunus yedoensis var. nudiflora]|uniref:Glutamate receptor 2.8 n=1 Tax=Prunus yedoensis var. nudiflora TaxID=2094558 RepID=A0A314XIX3_PRUYE|nr:glutamate receptor 2.8 [Prunus yedoensis var. nudiflora]